MITATSSRGAASETAAWYAEHGRRSRHWFQVTEVAILVTSASVPVVGLLNPTDSRPPAIVGAIVVVLASLRSIFHWQENWVRFMAAFRTLTAELRLYDAEAEPYSDPDPRKRDAELIKRVNALETTETGAWIKLVSHDEKGKSDAPSETA
ncbi:hypothetical protein AHiyo6_03320 [Arthrobacter sp. Hiyo6]|jgi:hypothetical protein|nr:hypothetical protein AHiyo6_03320 [Arthrobacter sp. Hiyo6]